MIERQGRLVKKQRQGKQLTLTFSSKGWAKPLKRGESIAVNGVCLTVAGHPVRDRFQVNVVSETIEQTTIGSLRIREAVNLERSLKWGERIGGHFVLGHVDGVGRIVRRKGRGHSFSLVIEVPNAVVQFLVPKGSIAVDGVSLTLQKLSDRTLTIAVVPHTAKYTTIGKKKLGDRVNLEADVIAKHLAHIVTPAHSRLSEYQ